MNYKELYHHGIKGMKWGVRHDKKPTGKKRLKATSSDTESSKKRLSDRQKRAIKIGAAVVGTALVAYGAYKLGAFDKFKKSGKYVVDGMMDEIASETKTKSPLSEIIKGVNPTKSTTNCRAASIATVLRLKGINAEALDIDGGSHSDAVKSCFKGARVMEMYSPTKDRIDSRILKKYGEGASGILSAGYKTPLGKMSYHATAWRVKNGIVEHMDGQKELVDCTKYFTRLDLNTEASITRLDNLEIDYEGLSKFVKIRK